jgi:hypothetical protein
MDDLRVVGGFDVDLAHADEPARAVSCSSSCTYVLVHLLEQCGELDRRRVEELQKIEVKEP